jgi:hypothetical protein
VRNNGNNRSWQVKLKRGDLKLYYYFYQETDALGNDGLDSFRRVCFLRFLLIDGLSFLRPPTSVVPDVTGLAADDVIRSQPSTSCHFFLYLSWYLNIIMLSHF